jgi:hypothetical protein
MNTWFISDTHFGHGTNSLTIDQLFDRIINTKHVWDEQELCLILIEEYKNGKRWKRKEV